MKRVNYLIFFFVFTLFAIKDVSAQIGQETSFDRQLRSIDDQPLREFVESKENIDVKQKANNLDISGDVRFYWQNLQEKGESLYENISSSGDNQNSSRTHEKYRAFRGGNHVDREGLPLGKNIFDVEFNLKMKYSYKKSWAMAHIQLDNPAGSRASVRCKEEFPIFNESGSKVVERKSRNTRRNLKGSGLAAAINLKRAYIGYNVWADGKHRVDIELGRRKFDDIFLSEIQFGNRFDGILLKYATAFDEIADFYWNTGAFVIDQRVNHFGYVTELGLLNIGDYGIDLRYSFVNWSKYGRNRCFYRNPEGTDFANSQISFSYKITPEFFCTEVPVEFYGGFLVNHAAKATRFTKNKKENLGWYGGIYLGQVIKEGDWAIDIEYVVVQAQAVPDADISSIGRGNIFNEGLFDEMDDLGSLDIPRRGNGNFYGWRLNYLYALTDNLTADFVYQWSQAQNRRIGGTHSYHDFEMEVIYAF